MKNLRTIILIAVGLFFLIPTLESCRKGPEDPYWSIFSRKNRITNNWVATEYYRNKLDFLVRSDTNTFLDTFCPDDWTFVNPGIPIPSAQWYFQTDTDLTYLLELETDGDFSLFQSRNIFESRTISNELDTAKRCRNINRRPIGGDSTFTIGEWNFGGAVGTKRNKEQLVITDFADFTSVVFDIIQLRKDQMKLERRFVDTSGGQNSIVNIEATLVPVGEENNLNP